MKLAKTIATGLLLAIAPIANAQWSGSGIVTAVYSYQGYYFLLMEVTDNPCGSAGKFWWPAASNADAKDMYAMALTALAADKKVSVVFDETAPNCMISGARATHMVIVR